MRVQGIDRSDVVSFFLLGSKVDCTMYPTKNQLISRILSAFGIRMDQRDMVEQFITEWGKGGQEGIMCHVFNNIIETGGGLFLG